VGHPESCSRHGTHGYTVHATSDVHEGPLLFFNLAVCIVVVVSVMGVVVVSVVGSVVVVCRGEGWWWWCVW